MRITRSTELQLPGVRILHFERLVDKRGYFTEHYSKDEVAQALACAVGESFDVKQVLPNRVLNAASYESHGVWSIYEAMARSFQANESFSRANVVRGLHLQWAPYMGKLIRVVKGRMLSLVNNCSHSRAL